MLTKCNSTVLLTVILLTPLGAQGLGHWDVYSDAVMQEGDMYAGVSVYDTPPNRTTLTVLGGSADYVITRDSSILDMFDGHLQLYARDHSVINVNGGCLNGADVLDHAVMNFLDGVGLRYAFVYDSATLNMFGGAMERLVATESGAVNLYGGQITDSLDALASGVVNIHGSAFVYDPTAGPYGAGQITGLWLDGTPFAIDLAAPEAYSRINLVPEPATLLLLSVGGAIHRWFGRLSRTRARTRGDVC